MTRKRLSLAPAVAWLALAFAGLTWGLDISKLTPRGYVNDFAGVLDPGAAAAIETYCGNVERATGAQFAVVLVKSLDDNTVETVSVDLYKQWGIGKKGTDEGLLILFAIDDRKNRIEVGYGLEPIITDGQAGDVLRSIRPILRQGDYGGAIMAAVQQLGGRVAEAKGVTIDGQAPTRRRRQNDGFPVGAIIGMVVLGMIVLSAIGRRGGGPRGGGGGGGDIIAGLILGQMLGGGRRHGGGWSGGGFGGSGGGGGGGNWGGGGGFGGFGGGGSGGGGASGGW
jgi:uncharacterized protein